MSETEIFHGRVTQARQMAAYTMDRRIRVILQVMLDEIEQKITLIERRQALDARAETGALDGR
jgi:hypothetical protein